MTDPAEAPFVGRRRVVTEGASLVARAIRVGLTVPPLGPRRNAERVPALVVAHARGTQQTSAASALAASRRGAAIPSSARNVLCRDELVPGSATAGPPFGALPPPPTVAPAPPHAAARRARVLSVRVAFMRRIEGPAAGAVNRHLKTRRRPSLFCARHVLLNPRPRRAIRRRHLLGWRVGSSGMTRAWRTRSCSSPRSLSTRHPSML
jgi:hypothetical protein